jgi:hypothetical protein
MYLAIGTSQSTKIYIYFYIIILYEKTNKQNCYQNANDKTNKPQLLSPRSVSKCTRGKVPQLGVDKTLLSFQVLMHSTPLTKCSHSMRHYSFSEHELEIMWRTAYHIIKEIVCHLTTGLLNFKWTRLYKTQKESDSRDTLWYTLWVVAGWSHVQKLIDVISVLIQLRFIHKLNSISENKKKADCYTFCLWL